MVPQFDIDDKSVTRGKQEAAKEPKYVELDLRGPFQRLDVMTELQIDPDLLKPGNSIALDLYLRKDIQNELG